MQVLAAPDRRRRARPARRSLGLACRTRRSPRPARADPKLQDASRPVQPRPVRSGAARFRPHRARLLRQAAPGAICASRSNMRSSTASSAPKPLRRRRCAARGADARDRLFHAAAERRRRHPGALGRRAENLSSRSARRAIAPPNIAASTILLVTPDDARQARRSVRRGRQGGIRQGQGHALHEPEKRTTRSRSCSRPRPRPTRRRRRSRPARASTTSPRRASSPPPTSTSAKSTKADMFDPAIADAAFALARGRRQRRRQGPVRLPDRARRRRSRRAA